MSVIAAIVSIACICVAVPVAFLAFECLLGAGRRRIGSIPATVPPFVVLMPAHDEAAGIAAPIRATLGQLRPCDRLLVVADNCSDDTASIARSLGAEVIERFDPVLRGKGYALEFGRAHLRGQAGDVIIILDADCVPEPDALARLTAASVQRDAVVQGAYLMTPRSDASAKVRISCFAFMIKNLVRQRALDRMAGVALLQGSGMAFPRKIFDSVEWHAASLVEDLDMGLELLLSRKRVIFADSALFLSDASSEAGTIGQRRRWEHGMLQSMGRHVPGLLLGALAGRWRLGVVALDLIIPPTVMLIAISVLVLALGAAMLESVWPVWLLFCVLALLGLGLASAWRAEGRDMLPARSIGQIPGYIFWKLPIIARFFTQREKQWIRTEREP
jgi:cellulose synthase/poly-beta-1,6-N-acetylglucosamine synthase-like glycosyltransferase